MSEKTNPFCDQTFGGVTRLFPLPGLVMFPHVVQALHIFEARYREMLEDAMADDRLISMAVPAPGWEQDYHGAPALESVVCLGQIVSRTRLPDGCSNILVVGLRRARILRELKTTASFRTAQVELMSDIYSENVAVKRSTLKEQLMESFQRLMPKSALAADQLTQTLGSQISLGILTDLMAYSLKLPVDCKNRLLAETCVDRRAAILLEHFDQVSESESSNSRSVSSGFPPDFSAN